MQINFKAIALANELNLNVIATHFGIQRKFKWEDILSLKGAHLQGVLNNSENKNVHLFHFGAMVCIGMQHHEIMDVIAYLQKLVSNINSQTAFVYEDDYSLDVSAEHQFSMNNDSMCVERFVEYQSELIATVLAKSVALEKNEKDVDVLLDRVENVIANLQKGQLGMSDQDLAKMSASTLKFKLDAVSHLMILDNPDITWNNDDAADLYQQLVKLFELKERYEILQHKTQTLMDITDSFTDLVHAKRSTRLEWIIIVLIAFEFLLAIYTEFAKR